MTKTILEQASDVASDHVQKIATQEREALKTKISKQLFPFRDGIESHQPVAPEHREAFEIVAAYLQADLLTYLEGLSHAKACGCGVCQIGLQVFPVRIIEQTSQLHRLKKMSEREAS